MEAIFIDVGALGLFLGCMAFVYWRAVAPPARRLTLSPRDRSPKGCS